MRENTTLHIVMLHLTAGMSVFTISSMLTVSSAIAVHCCHHLLPPGGTGSSTSYGCLADTIMFDQPPQQQQRGLRGRLGRARTMQQVQQMSSCCGANDTTRPA